MKDPPSDFKIMRVVVRSALPDTKYADAYDEFGEKIPAHTEKGKGYIRTITIDRKDMQKSAIKSSQAILKAVHKRVQQAAFQAQQSQKPQQHKLSL